MKILLNILRILVITTPIAVITITDQSYALSGNMIAGRVLDEMTLEPLAGVNIVVIDSDRGASTDIEGIFIIDNLEPGAYRLEITYIGYITQKYTDIMVSPSKPTNITISLTEQILETDAITVSAGYFVESNMTQPSTIGLSREEIRRFPGGFEDVVRTVSTLPGVAVVTYGGRNDLLVRGGGPSENLYTINNIEVPNINHFGTQGTGSGSLSFINLDFVENVTFSTGGFSARYGDKMSSTLALDMAQGRNDKFGSKLLISATQFGFNLEGPLTNQGNFIFSARKSYLDLIFRAAGLAFVPEYTDYNLITNFKLSDKEELFIIGLAAIDRVDRDLSTEENRVTNAGIMDNSQNLYITGINYRRLLDTGYLDLTLNANFFDYKFSQVDENGEKYFQSDAEEKEFGLKAQRFIGLSKGIGLLGGFSARLVATTNQTAFADTIYDRSGNKVTPESLGLPSQIDIDESGIKASAFLDLDWKLSPYLTLNFGTRVDYYKFLEDPYYFSPRFTARFNVNDKLSFKTSLGRYYQSPSYVWMVSEENRNLKALQNNMAIIGAEYLIQDDLRVSVETFFKRYRDLPTGTTPDVNDYLVITNTGTGYGGQEDEFQSFGYFPMVSTATGTAYGFEWLLQKKFSSVPCYGQLSFAYSKGEFIAGNGLTYPGQYDQRIIFNISGGYMFNEKWEISTKYRYYTGAPYTSVYVPSENPVNPGYIQNLPEEYLSERLVAQGILDFRADRFFNFSNWRLVVFVDIQNVLNQKIAVKPTYNFWTEEVESSGSIGILPSIGISAEF